MFSSNINFKDPIEIPFTKSHEISHISVFFLLFVVGNVYLDERLTLLAPPVDANQQLRTEREASSGCHIASSDR